MEPIVNVPIDKEKAAPEDRIPDLDAVLDRTGTDSLKWDRYRGRDVLPLWVADMDFPAPEAVQAALRRRVAHPVFGYTVPPDRLKAAVQEWLLHRYGWQTQPQWLVWMPGVVSGFNVVCRAFGEMGDEVLCPRPVYPPFFRAPALAGKRLAAVDLSLVEGRWTYDMEKLSQAFTPRSRILLFCHPHNPTGTVFFRKELKAIAGLCIERGVIICSDEIHCDLILGNEGAPHLPIAALDAEVAEHTITLMAPSKTFNIPGLGFAFAVIPSDALRRRFRAAMEGIVPEVNLMGFAAALAAFEKGWDWLKAVRRYLTRNRDETVRAISRMPALSMTLPEATFLAWIDARGLALENPARFFEAAGVGLSDGKDFGAQGFVRLNFACPGATLKAALGRMETACAGLMAASHER